MLLSEDLFDDIVVIEPPDIDLEVEAEDIELEGPTPGLDTGLTDLILSLINDENSTIQQYNSFKASLDSREDFNKVIDDIIAEEMNHVGMLQSLLQKLSPNAENIEQGKEEAKDILDIDDENDYMIDNMYGDIDDSF